MQKRDAIAPPRKEKRPNALRPGDVVRIEIDGLGVSDALQTAGERSQRVHVKHAGDLLAAAAQEGGLALGQLPAAALGVLEHDGAGHPVRAVVAGRDGDDGCGDGLAHAGISICWSVG